MNFLSHDLQPIWYYFPVHMHGIRKILITTVVLASIASFSLGWFCAKNAGVPLQKDVSAQTIGEMNPDPELAPIRIRDIDSVWNKLKDSYYDASKLDREKMEYSAVKGFIAGIGDPYTVFMTPEEAKDFEDGLNGLLEGIGAELEVKAGKLVVVSPLKDSPAEKAGVKPGDIIQKIDGSLAEDMTLYEAIRKIRGKKGTQVALTIIRENVAQPIELKITRSSITIDSVVAKKLDGDIYHVEIRQFSNTTKNEFQSVVQKILLDKAKGIIVDVRGDGGGYFDTSVDIISEFISGEKAAAVIKRRDQSKNETVKTNGSGRLADIPLVVLINKGSASASEIFAGAIQDYKRGILIGEKTFGKGSVQELVDLQDGSNLRLTIAKWFTPLGRSIDEVGISPDREIKLDEKDVAANKDPQLDAAIQYLKNKK